MADDNLPERDVLGMDDSLANHTAKALQKAMEMSDEDLDKVGGSELLAYEYKTKLDPRKMAYLMLYADSGSHTDSYKALGLSSSPHNRWLAKDKVYREAYEIAASMATDRLVDEARKRAVHGVKRKRFFKGEPIMDPETGKQYEETEYSDQLLMFLLKGARPEVFREKSGVDVSVNLDVAASGSNTAKEVAKQKTEFLERAKQIRSKVIERNSDDEV